MDTHYSCLGEAVLTCTHNTCICFEQKIKNIKLFGNEILNFYSIENCSILHVIIFVLIIKTCLCNVYPLEPHFYIAKLGYAGVYLFFLFLLQNIDCGYSLEPPRRGGSNVYPQSMF